MGAGLKGPSAAVEPGCASSATTARVSALVVNFNSRECVLHCLAALRQVAAFDVGELL